MQLRTPPRAPRGAPPLSQWRARRRLRRSAPRPPTAGRFSRSLARSRLRREFRRAARDSRAPISSRMFGLVRGPFQARTTRPRGPLFRGKLDRTLALAAILVLGGGVTALVLLSGTPAPTGLQGLQASPTAPPLVVPVVTPSPAPTPSVHASPIKHPTSKPATSHSTKAVHTTQPAPANSTLPAPPPPPQTNPPNPSPHPTTQPPKPSPSPTHSPSPTSSPSSSPSPTPSPVPTPSLTTPPIPG